MDPEGRKYMQKFSIGIIALLFVAVCIYGIFYMLTPPPKKLSEVNNITLNQAPHFGLWMLNSSGQESNWLSQKYKGKEMREPINIILIDEVSSSPEEAKKRLSDNCLLAGYDSRTGHSAGYKSLIGNVIYTQIPEESNHAFSNTFYIFPNNHGRIFGPHYHEGKYYFTGALSRETIDLFATVKHAYSSFKIARDDFAMSLNQYSGYKIMGKIDLKNLFSSEDALTTGDHDGFAIVLVINK